MKDSQLRKEVDTRLLDISTRRHDLSTRVGALEELRLAVKRCVTCSHDTLHQFHPRLHPFTIDSTGIVSPGRSIAVEGDHLQQEDFHRCLTCGKDWVYGTEETARPYKPQKGV